MEAVKNKKIVFSDILCRSTALVIDNIGTFLQGAVLAALFAVVMALLPLLFFGLDAIRTIFSYTPGVTIILKPELPSLKILIMMALSLFCIWALMVIFCTGILQIVFDLVDHKKSKISRIWVGDKKIISFLGASLLFVIIVSIGLLLAVIPGLYAMLCLQFFNTYIVDRGMKPVESLKASIALTKEFRWQLLLWAIILIIMHRIIGIFIIPIGLVGHVILYRTLLQFKHA